MKTDCYKCKHRAPIAGDCHSRCKKPDKNMTGDARAIKHGWFMYPHNFDPIWVTKECINFKGKQAKDTK